MSNAVGSVDVVRVSDEHIEALAEFYRKVWNPDATPEAVRAGRNAAASSNVAAPGEAPPTWLVLQNGHAIAHVTTIPIRLWLDGREQGAYWIKGLWVLPEVQRSSAGFLVLRAAVAGLSEPTLALVHEPAAIRLFQALKYSDLGGLPNRLRILRPSAVLARLDDIAQVRGIERKWLRIAARAARYVAPLLGPVVAGVNSLWAWWRTGSLRGLTISVVPRIDRDEVDSLWQSVREELGPAVVRGGEEIVRRYNGPEYVFVQVRDGRRLVGLAVVKRPSEQGDPRLVGLRIATLSDALYRAIEPRVAFALVRGAERASKTLAADALLVSASPRVFDAVVRRLGYVNAPANLHVLVKVPQSPEHGAQGFGDWWITRGDSEGDGTF
ncbi:MAG TPA: hypothetical protein VJO33_03285 [Gemmatimonadaceae bacterium]|nr:hypothetical protein [Gemmatimonadaceae bacterium]